MKLPSPHYFGIDKVLRPLRPIVSPVLEYFPKRRLRNAVNVSDMRAAASKRMHRMCFGYLDGGADDEVTLHRNKDNFSNYVLHYRVLSGISSVDTSTQLLGKTLDLPFFACPCAGNRMFHTQGERAVFETSSEFGSAYAMSALATTPVTALGDTSMNLKIFQLYLWNDPDLVRGVLDKAKQAGFTALALTVDFSFFGNRERDKRNRFTIPPDYSMQQVVDALAAPAWTWDFLSTPEYTYANLNEDVPAESLADYVNKQLRPDYSWEDAVRLKEYWGGPVLIKGVVRPDDAKKAVDHGFDLWLSNHGGRQLDGSPAPIDVLADIRREVGKEPTIVLDGGVQRGTDVVKALALGADAVGIGKAYLYGLAAGGKPGVQKVFEILKAQVANAMGLLGVASVSELKDAGPDLVKKR